MGHRRPAAGVYKSHPYGNIILPMTILRRFDCLMEPSRDRMRQLAAQHDNPTLLATKVKKECGLSFHNTSEYDLAQLVADPDGLAADLLDYLGRFSPNIDVFERFKFEAEVGTLAEKNRLQLVVRRFAEIDLHPDVVPNAEMGDIFEESIRKFAEASNEEAGEHFTPRRWWRSPRSSPDSTSSLPTRSSARGQKQAFVETAMASMMESETLYTQAATGCEQQFAESSDVKPELLAAVSDGSDAVSKIADCFFSDSPGVDGLVLTLAAVCHARVREQVAAR